MSFYHFSDCSVYSGDTLQFGRRRHVGAKPMFDGACEIGAAGVAPPSPAGARLVAGTQPPHS